MSGQPAAGVEVRVASIGASQRRRARSDGDHASGQPARGNPHLAAAGQDRRPGPVHPRRHRPRLDVLLVVRDPRFAQQDARLETEARDGRQGDHAWPSSRRRSSRAASWPPTPACRSRTPSIAVRPSSQGSSAAMFTTEFRADDQGRFTANPIAGEYFRVDVYPPRRPALSGPRGRVRLDQGGRRRRLGHQLPRGVADPRQGDRGGDRPAAGRRPACSSSRSDLRRGPALGLASDRGQPGDGSFQIAVPPGKGHLLVFGPTADYVLRRSATRCSTSGQPGGRRYYAHAIIAYEVKAGETPHEVDAALRPGRTIKGRVVGPDGQTVTDASIITHAAHRAAQPLLAVPLRAPGPATAASSCTASTPRARRGSTSSTPSTSGRDGRGSPASRPARITVRLQPCGQAGRGSSAPTASPSPGYLLEYSSSSTTPGPSV